MIGQWAWFEKARIFLLAGERCRLGAGKMRDGRRAGSPAAAQPSQFSSWSSQPSWLPTCGRGKRFQSERLNQRQASGSEQRAQPAAPGSRARAGSATPRVRLPPHPLDLLADGHRLLAAHGIVPDVNPLGRRPLFGKEGGPQRRMR